MPRGWPSGKVTESHCKNPPLLYRLQRGCRWYQNWTRRNDPAVVHRSWYECGFTRDEVTVREDRTGKERTWTWMTYRLFEMTIISTTSRPTVNEVSRVVGVGNATLESSSCWCEKGSKSEESSLLLPFSLLRQQNIRNVLVNCIFKLLYE